MANNSTWYKGYELWYNRKKDNYEVIEPMKVPSGMFGMGMHLKTVDSLEDAKEHVDNLIEEKSEKS